MMTEAAVKERPILFSGAMVRAILEGRKTVTRRVMKQQPTLHKLIPKSDTGWQTEAWGYRLKDGSYQDVECDGLGRVRAECPYGVVGDRLWVRETWAPDLDGFVYRADGCWEENKSITWKPSIHMLRKASRITLEVTGVRVERLQDISEGQAMREGVDQATCPVMQIGNSAAGTDWVGGFKKLWDSINGDRPGCSWSDNPWVWVVEFKRHDTSTT